MQCSTLLETLPEKQLCKILLFKNLRQLNGDIAFRQLCEGCVVRSYKSREITTDLALRRYFIYVLEGELLVYKVVKNSSSKSLIKSFRGDQYYNFQDFPLFWGQSIIMQANANTKLIIVKLDLFCRYFRRAVPISYLQSKALFLSKFIFKSIENQKLFKLSCISQKLRVSKQKMLIKEGDKLTGIIFICSGEYELTKTQSSEKITIGPNKQIFVEDILTNIEISNCSIRCVQEGDILFIHKQQYLRILGNRLVEQKRKQSLKSEIAINEQSREKSISVVETYTCKPKNHYRMIRSAKIKTEAADDEHQSKTKKFATTFYQKSLDGSDFKKQNKRPQTGYSLGEIQLLKFIKRKQKIETRNFFSYIQSRAPEIVLNPSKQFAIVKPLYKSNCLYVKNMKRKIKKSMSMQHNSLLIQRQNYLMSEIIKQDV